MKESKPHNENALCVFSLCVEELEGLESAYKLIRREVIGVPCTMDNFLLFERAKLMAEELQLSDDMRMIQSQIESYTEAMEEKMSIEQKIKSLNKDDLQEILIKTYGILSEKQCMEVEELLEGYLDENKESDEMQPAPRMSPKYLSEKMSQIIRWMEMIEEDELCLHVEEYEDYSSGYWSDAWITEYYDEQGIGDKILYMIQFAQDCVYDRQYQEANEIYDWLWEMSVSTDEEFGDSVDLEILVEEKIVRGDLVQIALLTLYADYQVQDPDKRAADLYLYFGMYPFSKLHIEDMFRVGRENLTGLEQFWHDWIVLLQTKEGDVAGRLLKEAILYKEGSEGLARLAEENYSIHPSLYLAAMKEYENNHEYDKIEELGWSAIKKIDSQLVIRSEVALQAARASSFLMHGDKVMQFCWECFRSDSTVRNYLRLFGTKEMAQQYGMSGKEVLASRIRRNSNEYRDRNHTELRQNIIDNNLFYTLSFYIGDFATAKGASKNPKGSLGWSGTFIEQGIDLFLLYLYERPIPSKAATAIANYVGFGDESDMGSILDFENEIIEECHKNKVGMFWNYFQRWKNYFPMNPEEKSRYLKWAEKIVYGRADAIVGGQHRRQYGQVATLLAMVAEIKEDMGLLTSKQVIYEQYKRKFPRHSSFQAEMKNYFNITN